MEKAVDVKFKDLREAVVALNESGLLGEKIKLVGVDKETILKSFMAAMGKIEDVDGKFPGPKAALTLYNDIIDQEEKAVADKGKDKKAADKADKAPKAPKDKAPKAPKAPKDKKEKGPGVISSILDIITKDGPVTKDKILAKLVKLFPDREEDKMKKTVAVQLGGNPSRMEKERKIKFVRDDEKGTLALKTK